MPLENRIVIKAGDRGSSILYFVGHLHVLTDATLLSLVISLDKDDKINRIALMDNCR